MKILYSEVIEKFQDVLNTPKELIDDAFNKPDATDIVSNRYVSFRNFSDFYMIVVFEMDDIKKTVKILNAYTIYPKMMDGLDVAQMKPVKMLEEFMKIYGIDKNIPGFGPQKFLVNKERGVCFLGILDLEKYSETVKNMN
ncbi:MAG: hypothetical protein V1870_00720 [Candidatus Aenigmatarchaeota archaeon]